MSTIRMLPVMLVIAALVSVGLVLLLSGTDPGPSTGVGSPSPSFSAPPSAEPTSPTPTARPVASEILAAEYPGPAFDRNLLAEPTAGAGQSKLWFHDGSWWGMLPSPADGQFHIHELHWETQRWVDTGVIVDERPFAQFDVLLDGVDLHVVASGSRNSSSHAARVTRYAYDDQSRLWQLQPDFPRTVTAGGVTGISIAKAGDGVLWLSYVARRHVQVMSSSTGGVSWTAEAQLPAPRADSPADRAVAVRSGDGVAVVWTELQADTLHVSTSPADGGDWSTASTSVEGLIYGDDQLSATTTSDGTLLVVVRTSMDRVDNRNPDAPQLVLGRLRDGAWTMSVVGRVRDELTGPQVVVDDERGEVTVLAEVEGDIVVKRATIESLAFPSGSGERVLRAASVPVSGPTPSPGATAAPTDVLVVPELVNVTTTKQGIGELPALVVMAADDTYGRYQHAVIVPPGVSPPTAEGHLGPEPADRPPGLAPGTFAFLFRDSFTPFEPGPATASGWQTRDEPVDEVMTIAEPSADDPALRLRPNAGDGPRACRAFQPVASGVIVAEATVQVRGAPDSDATMTTLRSPEGEVVSVRFGEPGVFRFFAGDARANSAVAYQIGAWYVSVVTLDLGSQTYAWRVTPLGGTAAILEIVDVPLRIPATEIGEVCMQSANELAGGGVEMFVDDVSVRVGPGG